MTLKKSDLDSKKIDKNKSKKQVQMIFGVEVAMNLPIRLWKWIGILVGQAFLLVLLGVVVLFPQVAKTEKLGLGLDKGRTDLARLSDKLEQIDNFILDFAQFESLIGGVFPLDKDVGLMLISIRNLTQRSGVELVSYSVSPVVVDEGSGRVVRGDNSLELELVVSGEAASVQSFLELLDRSLPLKRVEHIQVVGGATIIEEDGEQLLEAKLVISNFYLPLDSISVNPVGELAEFGSRETSMLEQLKTYTLPEVGSESQLSTGNPNLFGL